VTGGAAAGDTGVVHGDLLIEFAEAVLGNDDDKLARARAAIGERMGATALVDAAAVAGLFNAIDRVADATGTPLEDWKAEQSEDLRDELRINDFANAATALGPRAAQATGRQRAATQS
jgi:hypothetical protein